MEILDQLKKILGNDKEDRSNDLPTSKTSDELDKEANELIKKLNDPNSTMSSEEKAETKAKADSYWNELKRRDDVMKNRDEEDEVSKALRKSLGE